MAKNKFNLKRKEFKNKNKNKKINKYYYIFNFLGYLLFFSLEDSLGIKVKNANNLFETKIFAPS
jgi:hypothetical protein